MSPECTFMPPDFISHKVRAVKMGRPTVARLAPADHASIRNMLTQAVFEAGATVGDLASVGMSRRTVQQYLGEAHESMPVEAAKRLLVNAYASRIIDGALLRQGLLKCPATEIDTTLYVTIGNPRDEILKSIISRVRLSGRTLKAIENAVDAALKRSLYRTSEDPGSLFQVDPQGLVDMLSGRRKKGVS
jgi:hypothetical protein